ncbi:MAG: VanZ family protein [Gottschalkiaceae bacterium]|nr:MAG: VanZ family protein [Gottschalkiaceae bacterium]
MNYPGRSGQVKDVLIDSTGGLLGIICMSAIRKNDLSGKIS